MYVLSQIIFNRLSYYVHINYIDKMNNRKHIGNCTLLARKEDFLRHCFYMICHLPINRNATYKKKS